MPQYHNDGNHHQSALISQQQHQHSNSSSSLVAASQSGMTTTATSTTTAAFISLDGHQNHRPQQLQLAGSNSQGSVNGMTPASSDGVVQRMTHTVKTWNPFEDSFGQLSEDHLFGQEFDKIRQQGSQSSENLFEMDSRMFYMF